MAGAKMSRDKMTNRMTKHFRFNSLGKLTDGINLTDRINLTDDYKTSLWRPVLDAIKMFLGNWGAISGKIN